MPYDAVFLAQLTFELVASLFRIELRLVYQKHHLVCHAWENLNDLARSAPVAVSKHGRPVVVVVAVEEFDRLMALEHPSKSPNVRAEKREREK